MERWTARTVGRDMVGDLVWVVFDIEQNIRSGAWGIGRTYRLEGVVDVNFLVLGVLRVFEGK